MTPKHKVDIQGVFVSIPQSAIDEASQGEVKRLEAKVARLEKKIKQLEQNEKQADEALKAVSGLKLYLMDNFELYD